MSNTQSMLDKAIKYYGVNDIVTIMLSQRRDKEINNIQSGRYEEWKRKK